MSVSRRLAPFGVTVFTEMTRLALEHDAINLGQGFPDWSGTDLLKSAAIEAIESGFHDQYPPSPGVPALRKAIAERYGPRIGRVLDPDTQITITCGCTEALSAGFLGLINPGDEVVLIEPYYDSYPVNAALSGAVVRYVTLRPPSFELDLAELASVVGPKTKALVLNTPHNPTGRVLTRTELEGVAAICRENDVLVISDEVYEEMTYASHHISIASLDGMWDRTLTLSSVGKTHSLTGWKLGWAIGPESLTAGLRAAHQYLTFTTPTPVQLGGVAAMSAPDEFYEEMRADYRSKRDLLCDGLSEVGFDVFVPQGTYFVLADHRAFDRGSDVEFARYLVEEARVAAIPPSVFYDEPALGSNLIRFAFCKQEGTLVEALERMSVLRA